MIEVRLRAAGSRSSSSPRWRFGLSLLALTLGLVVPVTVSRAQDSSASLRALTVTSIEGGEAVSITSGAASITLRKNGTIVLKGTEVIVDESKRHAPAPPPLTSTTRASEVF